ncbi:DUF308 domain-containing protein [Candidatus Saccharibacteria bacterium]|nr:DUF308 domain-containing protein [Candidatus Saccharibacteria bacterium]
MAKQIKNYIEHYWWHFCLQAVVAIAFGIFALVTPIRTLSTLIMVGALALIAIGVIGLVRVFTEVRQSQKFIVNLLLSLAGIAIGFYLAFNLHVGFRVIASVIGSLVLIRGLFDIIAGLHLKDPGDKFMWAVAGIAGVVLGIVMLNHPNEGGMLLFWLLGLYVLIFGLTNLFYAIHLRQLINQLDKKPVKKIAKKAKK